MSIDKLFEYWLELFGSLSKYPVGQEEFVKIKSQITSLEAFVSHDNQAFSTLPVYVTEF